LVRNEKPSIFSFRDRFPDFVDFAFRVYQEGCILRKNVIASPVGAWQSLVIRRLLRRGVYAELVEALLAIPPAIGGTMT
jgi:hypothetical protein